MSGRSSSSSSSSASAMGQIDPAPPAELVDAVSASPLEPFANPGAARQEPGEEPTMTQNVERPTMAADGFMLDPAAACDDCESDGFTKEELEWFAEQCKKCKICNEVTAQLVAVPVEKFVKIYLCEGKPPAPGVTHAHYPTSKRSARSTPSTTSRRLSPSPATSSSRTTRGLLRCPWRHVQGQLLLQP